MTISALNPTQGGEPQSTTHTLPVSRAVLFATLVVGVLDAVDGVVFRGLQGQNPIQVLQYIASSLLGARSFSGGLATAGLGVIVHFAIALVVAAIYILARHGRRPSPSLTPTPPPALSLWRISLLQDG